VHVFWIFVALRRNKDRLFYRRPIQTVAELVTRVVMRGTVQLLKMFPGHASAARRCLTVKLITRPGTIWTIDSTNQSSRGLPDLSV